MKLLTKDQREEKNIIKQLKKGKQYQIDEYLFLLEKTGGEVSYINEFISALLESRWQNRLIDVAKALFRINYEKFYEQIDALIDALLSRELYSRNHFLGGSWIEIVVNHEFSEKSLSELEYFSLCEEYAICFMKQYKDYICCEDVLKRVISWIENIEDYVPSWEEENQYALQNLNKKNNRVKYALTCFKQANVVDDQTFETVILENGRSKTILSYLKMDPKAVINWLEAEDRLCELKDVDSLLEFLKLYEKSNRYRIGNIILKYGTVSQISSFVRDYPGILRSEDVVEKLKQTEHGSDLIPSLSKIEEDFEGRKELEERIFQESDPDQLVEYLCSLNVLNRVQGEDYLLETKSQDDIARYFGDYHDLVRQEQKFLDYLTTIHNRNTLQDAFHFLEYKPDRKKGLSYLEAFLRVRNIDGILTIWREIKETGETLYECLIKQGWLDLEDVKDLLLITSNQEHQSLLKRVKGEYQGPVKNLAERVDQMALDEDYVTDVDSEFMSPEEQLWLVNLSLTRENVLPSAVRNIEEVKENIELYLELLKKCDERKYMYYQDAFAGTRTFEIADQAYQYYLKNQEEKDSKIDLGKMLTYTKVK